MPSRVRSPPFVVADRKSWNNPQKRTYNGQPITPLYIQHPRRKYSRSGRRKPAWVVYSIGGKPYAYRNHGLHQTVYLPMGGNAEQQRRLYDTFVRAPVTGPEQVWLNTHAWQLFAGAQR